MGTGIQPPIISSRISGSKALDINFQQTLPEIVVEDQIVIANNASVNRSFVSTNTPENPLLGDIWVKVAREKDLGPIPPPGQPLEAYTWEDIGRIGKAGLHTSYFAKEQLKNFTVGGTTYQLELIAFDHDDLADGSGKAPYTFLMKNCLDTLYRINQNSGSQGGYYLSEFYGILNGEIYASLEESLRQSIRPVIKYTGVGDARSSIIPTIETLWLPSEMEMFGSRTESAPGEGSHYTLFNTAISRGKGNPYWLRSPRATSSGASVSRWCAVGATGTASVQRPDTLYGIPFGLCL